jgi:predicted nucleic acid-binding protein
VILADTNVLLDLLTAGPNWSDWSERQLETARLRGPIGINEVVYAELSVRAKRMEDVDAALQGLEIEVLATPRAALFMAGKVFAQYRVRGGTRSGVLPDFFIGAHAAVAGLPLLTRDARRLGFYFPTVELITPDERDRK